MLLDLIAAVVLTTSVPLADANHDGRITLTKALGPFHKGDVLTSCGGNTYAIVCPVPVDPMALQGALRIYAGKHLWWNSYPDAPIDNFVIATTGAVCKETCIWYGRASSGGWVHDVEVTRAGPAGPGSIDAGIKVGGSKGGVATTGLLIERLYSHGWLQNAAAGAYANGDGIVINRGVGTITIRDSRLDGNGDSGLDTKGDLTIVDNVSASGNGHYGFRFWGKVQASALTAIDNAWGAIEVEAGADVTIQKLVAVGGQELVTSKAGATVNILSCDLSRWTGTAKLKGAGKVTLGVGC